MTANPAPGGASSDVSAAVQSAANKFWRGMGSDTDDVARLYDILAHQPSAPATAQNDAVREATQRLAGRGRFPSGGAVPFDVARDLIAQALASPPAPVEQAPEREDSMGEAVPLRPQNCIAAPSEPGDCYRACLATILGISASTIPNFNREPRDDLRFDREVRNYLAPLGWANFSYYCSGDWPIDKVLEYWSAFNTGVPLILSGKPAHHPDPGHSVVALNGEIVHDPSGAGISGAIGEWWFIDVISPLRTTPIQKDKSRG